MKKLYILLCFCAFYTATTLAQDSTQTQQKQPKIILDNTPLKPEEKIDKRNTTKLKELIRYISPQEMESQKVLFYELENNYDFNPLFPRLVKYLLEDGNAKKIHTIKNTIAILVSDQFDAQNFEENAKRINLKLTKTSKEAFLKL